MPEPTDDPVLRHFDALAALPAEARDSALAALDLPAAQHAELLGLLAADALEDSRLDREIARAARRLVEDAVAARRP